MKTVSITFCLMALLATAYAQAIDKPTLDQYFDRLAEKNKAMGSLVIAKPLAANSASQLNLT